MRRGSLAIMLGLSLLLALLAVPAWAFEMMMLPDGQPAQPFGLDSQQPDTIMYDIGGASYYYGATNWWLATRFTAPSDFELRCIYLQMWNINNVSNGVRVSIHENTGGQPGTMISGPYQIAGPLWTPPFSWEDIELEAPFPNFTAGEEFFVVFGPAPMGLQTAGWFPMVDGNGSTESRSGYSSSASGPFSYTLDGDLVVRAGGEVTNTYIDMTVLNCFNNTQKFFLDSYVTATYKAEVKNVGNLDADNYRIIWRVRNAAGAIVYADSADYGTLTAGATAIQTCPSSWTTGDPGYYTAEASIWNATETLVGNNTGKLEQGIGPLGFDWYKYDDGTATTNVSSAAGYGWGNCFIPPSYPVKIDSVQVGLAQGISTSDVRIVNIVGSTFTTLYTYTGPLGTGMNNIDLSGQNLNIFSGGVGVGYMYMSPGSIYKDGDAPLAGTNSQMSVTSYDINGTTWTASQAGDYMIRAFCHESSAIPPYPVIRLEPDTLQYGEVGQGTPSTLSFWVCNDGGEDLSVTNIMTSGGISAQFNFDPLAFTVESLDSQEVQATWTPANLGELIGQIGVINNATAPYPAFIPMHGIGVPVGVKAIDGSLPTAYSFAGNYPNPFNNATRFAFTLPTTSLVTFKIYDVSGQEVGTLIEGWMPQGSFELTFDAAQLPSGVYVARLTAGSFASTQKMVLLK